MKRCICLVIIGISLIGAEKLGIFKEVTKAFNTTKDLCNQVKELQQNTVIDEDVKYTMSHLGDSLGQVEKQIEQNFELLDQLEKQNKRGER